MRIPKGQRTPMLEQYLDIKRQHPDAVLFYRMGDFFETFYDDAEAASKALGLRLTSRAHGKNTTKVPLAGFPHHQLDGYLSRMVEAGFKVVIVEQVEDPKKAKGLVKRDVVRIATVGTNPAVIDREEPSAVRLAALIRGRVNWGYAWANIATAEFSAGEFTDKELEFITGQIAPVELVLPETQVERGTLSDSKNSKQVISKLMDWVWEPTFARKTLLDHFGTKGLKGFGLDNMDLAVSAAGALLHYLKGNLCGDPHHLTSISRADVSGKLYMDASTRRNLELVESLSGNSKATLFAIIDRTVTGAGKRLLYNRLLEPLSNVKVINSRLESVAELKSKSDIRNKLSSLLKSAGDLQRFLARLGTGRGSARDLVSIRETLKLLPDLMKILVGVNSELILLAASQINLLSELVTLLDNALLDEPSNSTTDGNIIRDGYNEKVDELRHINNSGKSWIKGFERRERDRTGISNLKVSYNRVFGYFIEITKSHLDKVPDDYTRRQTLVNAERYTVTELSEYEEKLLGAEDEIKLLENEIYCGLVNRTLQDSRELQENASVMAELDFLAALGMLAEEKNWCQPVFDSGNEIELIESRHPVVEEMLPPGEKFVPNDLKLGSDDNVIMILTGPNMAGKSTYLRQVALTVILAQMGSFVPASKARIGLVDKLFTRIGALDNLAGGESTFLVEMHETAAILNNATDKSLVLFDEVGRGTSTFDGLSLAWSIIEYLHQNPRLKPRTLFATHFHEMVDLAQYLTGVVNYNVAVKEYEDKVVFLRKIIPGGSDRSFGIHVAQMAGLPVAVIERARELLANLEANDMNPVNAGDVPEVKKSMPRPHIAQLSLFDPVERQLRELLAGIDADNMTPIEALKVVGEIKKIL
ncbi:DNA mismatch repair protein MutS [bacterium]|nr:DNA mismatch repair protein MutS [bacterium]